MGVLKQTFARQLLRRQWTTSSLPSSVFFATLLGVLRTIRASKMTLRAKPVAQAVVLTALVAFLARPAPASAQSEAQSLADLIGAPLPKFPEGEELQALLKAAAAHPLGSAENPVRLGSIRASYIYISRLRCADGSRPVSRRLGQSSKMAFGRIADAYQVDCGARPPGSVEVHIDPYHPGHDEDRAPTGFTLAGATPEQPAAARPR